MSRCITQSGKICPFLEFNQKGNFLFHCNFNPGKPVQVPDVDIHANLLCPLDVGKQPNVEAILEDKKNAP